VKEWDKRNGKHHPKIDSPSLAKLSLLVKKKIQFTLYGEKRNFTHEINRLISPGG
jgi:hypothetical protein